LAVLRKRPFCAHRAPVLHNWSFGRSSFSSNGSTAYLFQLIQLNSDILGVLIEFLRGMPRKSSARLYALLLCGTASTIKGTSSPSCPSLELVRGGDTTSKFAILGDLSI
jgi:hypothetical protein